MARKTIFPRRKIYLPPHRLAGPGNSGFAVRWQTFLVDPKTGEETPLQSGHNMITDAGMNQWGSGLLDFDKIHCTEDVVVLKRLPDPSNELTLTFSGPDSVSIASSSGFFGVQDVDRVLKVDGWPELLITAFTDSQNITAKARGELWAPGFTPPASPSGPHTDDWGVHYTNFGTLSTKKISLDSGSFDTTDPDYDTTTLDAANRRFVHKRAWVTASGISGGATIRALAWGVSDPTVSAPMGVIALTSPDVIPSGKKYKVKASFYQSYPAQWRITDEVIDLGPIVGSALTLNLASLQYHPEASVLVPFTTPSRVKFTAGGYDLDVTEAWFGDANYVSSSLQTSNGASSLSSYVSGTHWRTKRIYPTTSVSMVDYAGGFLQQYSGGSAPIDVRFNLTPAWSKPVDVYFNIYFAVHWARELIN